MTLLFVLKIFVKLGKIISKYLLIEYRRADIWSAAACLS